MTDISDKVLDELDARGAAFRKYAVFDNEVDDFVLDLQRAITALRASVRELEEDREKLCEALTEQSRIGLRWAREARQVTREQRKAAICSYADHMGHGNLGFHHMKAVDCIIKALNLKIVEEAPKAEGRECDCLQVVFGADPRYGCVKKQMCVQDRCTITEGERDETR